MTSPIREYTKKDPESICQMFSDIAARYDCINTILSFSLHKIWNRKLIKYTLHQARIHQYLDLCCGTGEIALEYLKYVELPCSAYLLDFCPDMLEIAQKKASKWSLDKSHNIYYIQENAENIPLCEQSVDAITIAYGLRNIKNPQNCAKEMLRVLKPGGCLGILELTRPKNPGIAFFHALYLRYLLPFLGKLFAHNASAYQYLSKSIEAFISPSKLKYMLLETGFRKTRTISLSGGIATIIIAEK